MRHVRLFAPQLLELIFATVQARVLGPLGI